MPLELIPRNIVLEKLRVKEMLVFSETLVAVLNLNKPFHRHTLFKIRINILTSIPRSSKLSFTLKFLRKISAAVPCVLHDLLALCQSTEHGCVRGKQSVIL